MVPQCEARELVQSLRYKATLCKEEKGEGAKATKYTIRRETEDRAGRNGDVWKGE